VTVEGLEDRALPSALGLSHPLSGGPPVTESAARLQTGAPTTAVFSDTILDLNRGGGAAGMAPTSGNPDNHGGGGNGHGGYPFPPTNGPALRGETLTQPTAAVLALPVSAPGGAANVVGAPLAPALLPGPAPAGATGTVAALALSGAAPALGDPGLAVSAAAPATPAIQAANNPGPAATLSVPAVTPAAAPGAPAASESSSVSAPRGDVGVREAGADHSSHAAVPARGAVDAVFRESVAALTVRAEGHGPAGANQPGPMAAAGLVASHDFQAAPDSRGAGPAPLASQPPSLALVADIAPAAAPGAVLLVSGTAPPAGDLLPPGQQPTVLADLPSAPQVRPEDRPWMECLQASARAVLTSRPVQTLGGATAGLFAGCLLVVGLDRVQAPAEESARRRAGRAGRGPGDRRA
jgi:hypothetical protein